MAAADGDSPLQSVPPRNAQNGHHQVGLSTKKKKRVHFLLLVFARKESLKITPLQFVVQTFWVMEKNEPTKMLFELCLKKKKLLYVIGV